MGRTRLTLTLFTTIALATPIASAQNAAEPPAAPAAARAAVPPPDPNAAADMIAPPPAGGGAAAGFAIRPNARLIMAPRPRPARPVTTSSAPRPRPHQPVDDPIAAPPPRTNGPRVLSTLTRVEGGVTRANALRVMPQIEARAAQCFTRAMSMNPSVQGLMVIRFGIGPAGNVTSIEEAANYVRDSTLSDCLTASFPSVRFPAYSASAPALAMVQIRFLQR